MLRKARMEGMKYPRSGIIGDKPTVAYKSQYLTNWLAKNKKQGDEKVEN